MIIIYDYLEYIPITQHTSPYKALIFYIPMMVLLYCKRAYMGYTGAWNGIYDYMNTRITCILN